MKRLLVALLAVACVGISLGIAQNVNRSLQLSQDPSGPVQFDNQNGAYWPGKMYNSNNQTAPTLGTCGTSPTITGTSTAGLIVEGTGSPTSCQITFATAYPATPYCFAQGSSLATPIGISPTPNGFSLSHAASTSMRVQYFCWGQQP